MDIFRNFGLYVFLSLEENPSSFFFFFGEILRRKHDDEASIQLLNNKHASIYYYLKGFSCLDIYFLMSKIFSN